MTGKYRSSGDVVDLPVSGTSYSSGDVVLFGNRLGVALVDIADGETGAVRMKGVFDDMPKVTAAVIANGETLTWDVSVGKFDDNSATPAAGDLTGGAVVAVGAAGNGDTTMSVCFLNGAGDVN